MGRCPSLPLIFSKVCDCRQQLELSGAGEGGQAKGVHGAFFWYNALKRRILKCQNKAFLEFIFIL